MFPKNTLLPADDDLDAPCLSMADLVHYCSAPVDDRMLRRVIDREQLFPIPQRDAVKLRPIGRGAAAYLTFSLREATLAVLGSIIYRDTARELADCMFMARLLTALPAPPTDYIEHLFRTPRRTTSEARQVAVWVAYTDPKASEAQFDLRCRLHYPREVSAKINAGGFHAHVMDVEYYLSATLTLLLHTSRTNVTRAKAAIEARNVR